MVINHDMPDIANGMLGMQCYQFIGLNERIDGIFQNDRTTCPSECRRTETNAHAGHWPNLQHLQSLRRSVMRSNLEQGAILQLGSVLTPLNKSSGGKERLGKITKKGDRYIRKLLVVGMTSRAVMAKRSPEKVDLWTAKIIANKPFRLATTAMANKAARIIWAMLTKRREYRQPAF